MIRVTFYQDSEKNLCGFQMKGHADYAEYGTDIVCAAVSALSENCVNSIETFTKDKVVSEECREGYLRFVLEKASRESRLLLDSLELGISGIIESYGNLIEIVYEEVSS